MPRTRDSGEEHAPYVQPSSAELEPADDAYCPHCFLLVEAGVSGSWPTAALRCPHCRLLIGPGRSRADAAAAAPGARGTAAGIFAHRARRGADGTASPEAVRAGIRTVAGERGTRPERLLMVDYHQRAADDRELPSLADVLDAFGSWKRARRASAH